MTESFEFKDTSTKLSDTLRQMIAGFDGRTITLRELMTGIGEQGLLLVCAIASLPFLIPVSVPGVSTIFGAAIIMVSIAVTLNRLPWLPARILDKEMETARLKPALEKGVDIVSRLDNYVRPRFTGVTTGAVANRINGLALMASAVLLMLPLGLIPFSNTLPGIAILLLSIGMIQRDGLTLLAGYAFIVFTVIYFSALAYLAFAAGQGLTSIWG